jgi:hypothetical protein
MSESMKNVELVRRCILGIFAHGMARLRLVISCGGGATAPMADTILSHSMGRVRYHISAGFSGENADRLDRLNGEAGAQLVTRLVAIVVGHVDGKKGEDLALRVDRMNGIHGEELLAKLVEATLEHLGHKTGITTDTEVTGQAGARRSQARKAARGM